MPWLAAVLAIAALVGFGWLFIVRYVRRRSGAEARVSRTGLLHPRIVDLTTRAGDGSVRLILVEEDPVGAQRVPALQEKLTNYLAFAHDGLATAHPDLKGAPVRIRIDLYAQPDALALEFIRQFRVLALKSSVDVELSIFQKDVPL
jgi:hypothetical protein